MGVLCQMNIAKIPCFSGPDSKISEIRTNGIVDWGPAWPANLWTLHAGALQQLPREQQVSLQVLHVADSQSLLGANLSRSFPALKELHVGPWSAPGDGKGITFRTLTEVNLCAQCVKAFPRDSARDSDGINSGYITVVAAALFTTSTYTLTFQPSMYAMLPNYTCDDDHLRDNATSAVVPSVADCVSRCNTSETCQYVRLTQEAQEAAANSTNSTTPALQVRCSLFDSFCNITTTTDTGRSGPTTSALFHKAVLAQKCIQCGI